jgi:methylenetetrahydrofolate dehydrogenase (NADP+) / methenyltetrahydrofolate cyclohydrolase
VERQPAASTLSGVAVLRTGSENLAPYRPQLEARGRQVVLLRFPAAPGDSAAWNSRAEAARVSAEQKVKAFQNVGITPVHRALPGDLSPAGFAEILGELNRDPATAAVIVQLPVPPRLEEFINVLAPAKDLDGLLLDRSSQPACATADGIVRLVMACAQDLPPVAVVGAGGFVGSGVVGLLTRAGIAVIPIEAGEDLAVLDQADIVVSATGRPDLLTAQHIRPHHRLVVDAGFVPQPDGRIASDLAPEAHRIPQYRTPVPGGVGPVEMAVLMERIVRLEVAPDLAQWTVPALPFLSRKEIAANIAKSRSSRLLPPMRKPRSPRRGPGRTDPGRSS